VQLQKFCEKDAKGLVCDVRKEIIEQPRATSAGRQAKITVLARFQPHISL
jgi:hypothetical protein